MPELGMESCIVKIVLFYINGLIERRDVFYPMPRNVGHTSRAALMGPGDQPAFGGAGGLWQPGVVFPAGRVSLSHVPPGLRALLPKAPHAPAGQKAVPFSC
jgi:hypothetical protein